MFQNLRLSCYRLQLRALEPVKLPPFSGGTLRGALASTFRRLTCQQPDREECDGCMLERVCAFAAVFQPSPPEGAPNTVGFEKFPRPFAVVPPPAGHSNYPEGTRLDAGLTLVGSGNEFLPYFLLALNELASAGIGAGRSAVAVERVLAYHPFTGESEPVWEGRNTPVRSTGIAVTWEDAVARAAELPEETATIRFLTPTCLKVGGTVLSRPDFPALVRCLLRRVSRLAQGYCGGASPLDYASLIRQAEGIRIVASDLHERQWERHSYRQQRRIPSRGITGTITYAGPLRPFLPLVLIGGLVHIGDNAALGQGRYEVVVPGG